MGEKLVSEGQRGRAKGGRTISFLPNIRSHTRDKARPMFELLRGGRKLLGIRVSECVRWEGWEGWEGGMSAILADITGGRGRRWYPDKTSLSCVLLQLLDSTNNSLA